MLDTTSARLSFHAGSSLGDFEGTAHDRSGWVEATDLKSLRGAHGEVRVAVASIRTGVGMRDGHLRSDMQATQFPWFIVQVDSVHADPGTPGRAELFSRITFRGQSRARIMAAELRASDDSIAARGSFPMTFSEFGFKPPVRMLGLTKVKDAWQIFFDLRFVRAQQ